MPIFLQTLFDRLGTFIQATCFLERQAIRGVSGVSREVGGRLQLLPWRLWNFWRVYPWCIYLLPRLGSVFKQFYPQSGTNIWDFLCVSWVGWGVGRSSRHFSALEFNLGPNLAASPQFFAFGFNLGLEYLGKVPGTRLLKTKAFEIIVSYWIFYSPFY